MNQFKSWQIDFYQELVIIKFLVQLKSGQLTSPFRTDFYIGSSKKN